MGQTGFLRHIGLILFVILFWQGEGLCADRISAYLINSKDGLSKNHINDIYQDTKGYLWFATEDGLNRFDGYNHLIFRPDIYDSLSLISGMIHSVSEDIDGNIWVSTNMGISKYVRKSDKFLNISFFPRITGSDKNETFDIRFVNDTTMYCLLSNSLIKFFSSSNKFTEIPFSGADFATSKMNDGKLFFDEQFGNLYVGTDNGLYVHRLGTREIHDVSLNYSINDIERGSAGKIWLATNSGLAECLISADSGMPQKCETVLPGRSIQSISQKEEGILILATSDSLMYYNTESKKIISDDIIELMGYDNIPEIQELFVDWSENLWIATVGGVCKADLKPAKFSYYTEGTNDFPLNNRIISTIYADKDELYLGSWGGGLQLLNLKTGQNLFFSIDDQVYHYPERSVNTIFSDNKDRLWVAFTGIYQFDRDLLKFSPMHEVFDIPGLEKIDGSLIFDALQLNSNEFVFAHRNGLYFINEELKTYRNDSVLRVDSLEILLSEVTAIEKNNQELWIACRTGLICYDLDKEKHLYYPFFKNEDLNDRILSIKIDSQQRLWIGTPTGLFLFNEEKARFEGYSVALGFANDYIYTIEEDKNGLLWLSTNKGIISFNPENEEIRNYGIQHGLSCMEFNLNASYYANDGTMYFGGIDGVNFFYPDRLVEEVKLPATEITGVRYFMSDHQVYTPYCPEEIHISDDESIQLFFALLDHGTPEYMEFKYRLSDDGETGVWRYIGNDHSLILSGLKYGNYIFEVVGANVDGIWSSSPSKISLSVNAPFQRRPIFMVVMFIPAVLLIIFLFEYRTKTLRRSNKALREKEVAAKQVLKQKNLLMRRNKNIEDSLKYAQRIQLAMFTSESEIKSMFPTSFILQKPKDIVSGDFFWGRQIDNKIFLAAADCTGHGVPGAFMSIIGLEFFKQIILKRRIFQPAKILDEINKSFDLIFDNLDELEMRDGMDLAFIMYDKDTGILEYAGAFNPLYILRDGEIIEIKGDRIILGPDLGFGRDLFKNHEIQIQNNDTLYVFSDGYADQFGGPEGKKFKYRRFRHLLLSIYDKPLPMQKRILENSIMDWIGPNEQVDDILVIGFKPFSG